MLLVTEGFAGATILLKGLLASSAAILTGYQGYKLSTTAKAAEFLQGEFTEKEKEAIKKVGEAEKIIRDNPPGVPFGKVVDANGG